MSYALNLVYRADRLSPPERTPLHTLPDRDELLSWWSDGFRAKEVCVLLGLMEKAGKSAYVELVAVR